MCQSCSVPGRGVGAVGAVPYKAMGGEGAVQVHSSAHHIIHSATPPPPPEHTQSISTDH